MQLKLHALVMCQLAEGGIFIDRFFIPLMFFRIWDIKDLRWVNGKLLEYLIVSLFP